MMVSSGEPTFANDDNIAIHCWLGRGHNIQGMREAFNLQQTKLKP